MELKNKVIIVLGANGFLGSHFSKELIKQGTILICIDKKIDQIRKLKNKNIFFYKLNLLNEKLVKNIFTKIEKKFKKIDGLVNLVANDPKVGNKSASLEKFLNIDIKKYEKDLKISLVSIVNVLKYSVKLLLKSKTASVVNISSDLSIISPSHELYSKQKKFFLSKPISYSVSKHGIIGLNKYLSTYFAKNNIRFNCISPGGIEKNQPVSFKKKIKKLVPMSRMAKLDDLNSALIYFLSEKSSYTTGTNLVIDGGRSII